jgi:hypothetical protein
VCKEANKAEHSESEAKQGLAMLSCRRWLCLAVGGCAPVDPRVVPVACLSVPELGAVLGSTEGGRLRA